jgi:hypothetical protein
MSTEEINSKQYSMKISKIINENKAPKKGKEVCAIVAPFTIENFANFENYKKKIENFDL